MTTLATSRVGALTDVDGLVLNIFAGPGGWCTGARQSGYLGPMVGVEIDRDACATAEAAEHDRVQADVAAIPDDEITALRGHLAGLIGSPPCQAWSRAGKGLGLLDQPAIWAHLAVVERAGHWVAYPRDGWHDERSPLVLEILRWVLLARPRWFACEQVPDVLPFWRELARILRQHSYSTAAYLASAEEHGVPQTRQRAILTGSLDIAVAPPTPTHQRYQPGIHARIGEEDLFGDALLPWMSMCSCGPMPTAPCPMATSCTTRTTTSSTTGSKTLS